MSRLLSCVPALLVLAGCASSGAGSNEVEVADPPLEEEVWDVREAVFRHQFELNASGAQQSVDAYFLEVEGGDPPPPFLERFAGHAPAVKPVSAAESSVGGVRDRSSGGTGLIFRQGEVRWLGEDEAEVDGGYYEAGLSSSGNTYTVERTAGEWVVTADHMHWIS